MSIVQEFREFALKGNVLDLAVGVIIGGAFGKITTSLVNDIMTPPLGMLLAQARFRDLFFALNGEAYATLAEAREAGAPVLAYGAFLTVVLEFTLTALALFLVVKALNRLRRRSES